jgi:tRNA-Thr(GGU) m(6)t(6)A37 methyltransferase TsaA
MESFAEWSIEMNPIGVIETCFQEKFGVPRQSMMVKEAWGRVMIEKQFSHPDAVLHLDGFSHVWLIYLFHKSQTENHPGAWSPTITPPRIGAPAKVGVFASRSPHRPNPIGMSVVKLEQVRQLSDGRIELQVSGVDILDETPLLDIKPYLPYADRIDAATSGWIQNEIERFEVEFTNDTARVAENLGLTALITGVLEWDPRPRSQREHAPLHDPRSLGRRFAFRLMQHDIHWEIAQNSRIRVVEIRDDSRAT